jgi:CBS domain containing-hemolysin-like protein
VRRIPIIGEGHELLGIVALEDVMSVIAEEFFSLTRVSEQEKEQELRRRRKFA